MKQFFRERDGLGYKPQMTYKRKEKFGTTIGGCFSCCAQLFVLTYVGTIIAAFIIGGRNFTPLVQTASLPRD